VVVAVSIIQAVLNVVLVLVAVVVVLALVLVDLITGNLILPF
jgi:hypothetical protein